MLNLLRCSLPSNDSRGQSQPSKRSRLLLFAYCFLSFLPLLAYLVILPPPSFLCWLFSLGVHLNNGILLFVMSSVVREQMPFRSMFLRFTSWGDERHRSQVAVQISVVTQAQVASVRAPNALNAVQLQQNTQR